MLNNIIKSDCEFKISLETILLKYLNIVFLNIFVNILSNCNLFSAQMWCRLFS